MKNDAPKLAPAEPTKPRRRLTPEQRIAERKADIARIEEQQRERARAAIVKARESLELAVELAEKCGMDAESKRWGEALIALGEDEAGL